MSESNSPKTDIDAIMQEIRQEIITQRESTRALKLTLKGKSLPPEFYDHIYLAGNLYDDVETTLYVTESSIPLIGRWIDQLRTKLHEVVIFYINRSMKKQINVNRHLIQAINILAEELENRDQDAAADE